MSDETIKEFQALTPKLTCLKELMMNYANLNSDQTYVFLSSIVTAPFLCNLKTLDMEATLNLSRDQEINTLIDIMNAAHYIHHLDIRF